MPYEFDPERFSRWMSYVLRHNPTRFDLQPDRYGFVDFEQFLQVAQRRNPEMNAERLRAFVESSGADRFELAGNRLRARYGHSIPVEPYGEPVEPPVHLYHGTEPSRAEAILAEGLKPMDRQLLHLSQSVEDALSVARRRSEHPVVLRVLAQEAHRAGIAFYCEGKVYLTTQLPPNVLSIEPTPEAPTPEAPTPDSLGS